MRLGVLGCKPGWVYYGTSTNRECPSVHMDLMHVEQPLTGSAWAIGVLAIGLIVGGLPVASIGVALSVLTRRNGYQWQPVWRLVFLAGFVVQVCSLVPTVPIWLMALASSGLPGGTDREWAVTLILSGSVVGSSFALGAWRGLMAAALPESPPSILG
jgi:Na+/H+ antiporter NhaD/arsenite permease-like protein